MIYCIVFRIIGASSSNLMLLLPSLGPSTDAYMLIKLWYVKDKSKENIYNFWVGFFSQSTLVYMDLFKLYPKFKREVHQGYKDEVIG